MKNKVTKEDLKGEIKNFPLEIVQAMCDEQVRQGNKFNPEVFQEDKLAGVPLGGFCWEHSELGNLVWDSIISYFDFKKFYTSRVIVTKESVENAFKNADDNGKKLLKDLFGDRVKLYTDITERVKSFSDACEVLGISKVTPIVQNLPEKYQYAILANYSATIIAEALNEGWKPNWKDKTERKYFPLLNRSCDNGNFMLGYGFTRSSSTNNNTNFWFKSEKLAMYFGNTFTNLLKEILF